MQRSFFDRIAWKLWQIAVWEGDVSQFSSVSKYSSQKYSSSYRGSSSLNQNDMNDIEASIRDEWANHDRQDKQLAMIYGM